MAGARVTVYENPQFSGRSKTLGVGTYQFLNPADFNNVISSIKVAAGLCAVLFDSADDGGGYGTSVDLLEDWPDLAKINFNDKTSYISVFSTDRPLYVWTRNSMQNGQFVAGHWERQPAIAPPASKPVALAVVSPPYPPRSATRVTTLQVNGAETVITTLGPQNLSDASEWTYATANQAGVIGSDFRSVEEIGSACFERASNSVFIPDSFNFWYPQKQANDNRSVVYFKRTLAGQLREVHIAAIEGTYADNDVNIDIIPDPNYQYLLSDSHPREYTDIMSAEWNLSAHQDGQPNCDDDASKAEFTFVEAEIQVSGDLHSAGAQLLNDTVSVHQGTICVYGPWIYDRGHCCHAEIHPAEQVWWRNDLPNGGKKYYLNVFCDASQRFWWRNQMDDGTKLKPWGAPPIRGIFAIAFQVNYAPNTSGLVFDVTNVDNYMVAEDPNNNQVYKLTYQGRTLVQFSSRNNAFKVSFEKIGAASGFNNLKGFLVLETTVGTCTQTSTQAVENSFPPRYVQIPMGADVNTIDQWYEPQIFTKVEGHYMFTVTQNAGTPVLTT